MRDIEIIYQLLLHDFTLLLANWVTSPNVSNSSSLDGAAGKPFSLYIFDIVFRTVSKSFPGKTIISVIGVQQSQFFFGWWTLLHSWAKWSKQKKLTNLSFTTDDIIIQSDLLILEKWMTTTPWNWRLIKAYMKKYSNVSPMMESVRRPSSYRVQCLCILTLLKSFCFFAFN